MGKVILPDLGEGIENAKVVYWNYKVGDNVEMNDDLVELVTDKAVFNVPAGSSGIIKEILIEEGQTATVGEVMAVIS